VIIIIITSIKNNLPVIFIILIIPLAGELYFYPFNDFFRVSFGMPTLFFCMLMSQKKFHPFFLGILSGLSVVTFRILLDIFNYDDISLFHRHYPTFFYYFTFGAIFQLVQTYKYMYNTVIIGLIGVLLDILASLGELLFQYLSFSSITTYEDVKKISIIAIFRSFFTVGFLNLITLYKTQIKEKEIRKRNNQLILLISNLYEETINLHKTLENSENITQRSYELYILLKKRESLDSKTEIISNTNLHQIALDIAGKTHDIKKDNQRILAGLSNLIKNREFSQYMNIKEIIKISIDSNKQYALSLEKKIKFTSHIQGKHPRYYVYKILSITNNIITNSIEAIENTGEIIIYVRKHNDKIEFQLEDNGPGIGQSNIDLIFEPGFTDKYDSKGNPFTGIGMPYVKEVIESLDGEIFLKNKKNGLHFTIQLPIKKITLKG